MPDYTREEQKLAKDDGAKLVPNSGRGTHRKGDALLGDLLIDYKFTESKSFSVNDKAFSKHRIDAFKEGYEGVVVVYFHESQKKVAVVDWEYLKHLEECKWILEGLQK